MLLALSLMVSMLTIGTFAADTDKENPYIVSAVAISDTEIKVTLNEPIYVYNTGVWALFFAKDGVVDTATRTGGTVQVTAGTLCNEFVWTIGSGSISGTIAAKAQAGYQAYFGINTNNTYLEIAKDRATDAAGNMFLRNVESNGYSIHAISVDPYYNMIRSVTLIQEYKLEIEFLHPITEFVDGTTGVLLLGVLNTSRNGWYNTGSEPITTTKRLTPTVTERGTLLCTLSADLDGMEAGNKRNIAKYMEKVSTTYAAQGYVAGIQILEPGNGTLNDNLLERVVTADGTPLYGPQSTSGRAFCHAMIDSVYESAQLVSASLVSNSSIKIKFDKEVSIVSDGGGFGIVALDSNGNVLFDATHTDMRHGGTVDKTSGTEFVWTIDAGKNAAAIIEAWKAAGYTVKFCSNSGGNPNPAGYNPRVVDANGYPLPAPVAKLHTGTTYLYYALCDIDELTEFTLESVTQVAPYSVALKFSEDLRTDTRNGLPWIEDIINNSTNVSVGIIWVKDGCTGQEGFELVTADAIKGSVVLGKTNDTLIWTVNNEVPANFISNLLKETKDGYSRQFYLYDNGCGWHGAGFIGGIQAQKPSATEEKALVIPDSNKKDSGTYEYLFMDITPDSTLPFELLSVTEIGDYQLELQFSEAVRKETAAGTPWVDTINNSTSLGIAWVSDTATGAENFAEVVDVQIGGTVAPGETDDTLIWTMKDQSSTISSLLNESKEGYTRKFFLYDNGCNWHATGYIGAVQAVPNPGEKPLSIPNSPKTLEAGKEYLFMNIHSYVDIEQSEIISLEDKPYHFMNADTGRSLVVNGVEEFTIVRKAADSNLVMLMVGNQYVNLHSTPATLSDTAYNYLLEAREHGRYRILVSPIYALSDNDAGEDNNATLAYESTALKTIASGWYLTASGEDRPLRVLPIGDSITYGSNPDGFVHGWRDELSADLADKLDRVVFVGSQTSKISTVDQAELYRHEGNPGWTVTNIGASLNDIAAGVAGKYDPDVVLLMAGINDFGAYQREGKTDQEILQYLKTDYKALVEKLAANMGEDDVIFCSTLTPTAYTSGVDNPKTMNEAFPSWVKEWAAEGLPVALNDNYTALKDVEGVQCSDKLHLSNDGDALVAQQYAKSILNYYNADGSEKDIQEKINAAKADGQTELYLNGDETIDRLENIPAGFTLDLNGHVLRSDYVIAFGHIKDSTEGKGGIAIAKNVTGDQTHLLHLQADNVMMPLCEDGFGYRFFTCTTTQLFNPGTARFGFQININETGLALLKDAANADVEVLTKLIVTVDGEEKLEKDYAFQAATIADYATKKSAEPTKNWAIILTVTGFETLSGTNISMTSTPIFKSSTGVSVAPATDATVTYNHSK